MATKVEVQLFGASGTRQTTVESKGGFPTRGIKAPREAVPSLFGDVSIKRKSHNSPLVSTETTPEVSPQRQPEPVTKPTRTPLAPLGDPSEVRVYRVNTDGTQERIYIGCDALWLDGWCQEQADVSKCTVQKHTADTVKFFNPEVSALKALLMEVDAILDGGVENV